MELNTTTFHPLSISSFVEAAKRKWIHGIRKIDLHWGEVSLDCKRRRDENYFIARQRCNLPNDHQVF